MKYFTLQNQPLPRHNLDSLLSAVLLKVEILTYNNEKKLCQILLRT